MEDAKVAAIQENRENAPFGNGKRDLAALGLLLLLTLALHGWILWHTEVAARDSIGYIRYALKFEKMPWWKVLQLPESHQHPGYPLTVLAVSWPVRYFLGGITPENMRLSAQLATGLASVLLVIPMFYLGKFIRDRRLGFWSALLFQILPVSAHILSDGLSEGLYLLLFASALLAAVWAMQGKSPGWFALCGLLGGLCYLTRPEGALVVLASTLVLLAKQVVPTWRLGWRQLAVCGVSLLVTASAVGTFYVGPTRCFSKKPAVQRIMQHTLAWGGRPSATAGENPCWCCGPVARNIPLASIWGALVRKPGFYRCLRVLGTELVQGFHYVGWLPVLLGLWWYRSLFRKFPGLWVAVTVCLFYTVILLYLASREGYISDRHVLVMVMCGTYGLVLGLGDLPKRFRAWRQRELPVSAWWKKAEVLALACLLLFVSMCLPKTLQPLHSNRKGHHAAGMWLAHQVHPGDQVEDDHCWAHYYAGQVFQEGKGVPPGTPSMRYIVLGHSRDPQIAEERKKMEAQIVAAGGIVVYHWPTRRPLEFAKVVVYALPR